MIYFQSIVYVLTQFYLYNLEQVTPYDRPDQPTVTTTWRSVPEAGTMTGGSEIVRRTTGVVGGITPATVLY